MPDYSDQSRLIEATQDVMDMFPLVPFVTHEPIADLQKIRLRPALPVATEFITVEEPIADNEIDLEVIAETVANHHGVLVGELLEKDRNQTVVQARQVAMYLAKELTQMTSVELGRYFQRDHTTVLHGQKNVQNKLKIDDELLKTLETIRYKIANATEIIGSLSVLAITSAGLSAFVPERITQHHINQMLPIKSEYGLGQEIHSAEVINAYYPEALAIVQAVHHQTKGGFKPISVDVLNHLELGDI